MRDVLSSMGRAVRPGTVRHTFGEWGERQAAVFLRSRGYDIIAKNYRTRWGEIDLIAWRRSSDGRVLVFVEVKTRRSGGGSAERAHDGQKMARIMRTARLYCREESISMDHTPIGFEHVSVYAKDMKCTPDIHHYEVII